MNDKEWSEEHTHIPVKLDEYKKLKEQAERMRELEEEVQDISVWNHGHRCHIHKLKQQNKRYRELLEDIKREIEIDYTESEIQEWPLMDVIVGQISKALEGEE